MFGHLMDRPDGAPSITDFQMSPSVVTVLDHRFVKGGCSTLEAAPTALADALERRWPTDAHFQAFRAPSRPHTRVTMHEVGRAELVADVVSYDLDAPNHQASPDWRAETRELVTALFKVWSGYFYTTRNGGRLVWTLPEPFRIRDDSGVVEWRGRYLAGAGVLASFGLTADRACCDPMRLWRLPLVMRDGKPTAPEVIGDAGRVGVFALPEFGKDTSHVRSPASRQASGEAALNATDIRTPLLDDLERAGLIVGPGRPPGSLTIVCPNNASHSTGRAGDGSTLYFAPTWALGSGTCDCKHSHCRHLRSAGQWRREITKAKQCG